MYKHYLSGFLGGGRGAKDLWILEDNRLKEKCRFSENGIQVRI